MMMMMLLTEITIIIMACSCLVRARARTMANVRSQRSPGTGGGVAMGVHSISRDREPARVPCVHRHFRMPGWYDGDPPRAV